MVVHNICKQITTAFLEELLAVMFFHRKLICLALKNLKLLKPEKEYLSRSRGE